MGFLDQLFRGWANSSGEANFSGSFGAQMGTQMKDPSYSEGLKKIEKNLETLEPSKAQYLSALAMLLARVAYADMEISEQEEAKMKEILGDRLGLDSSQAELVAELARHEMVFNGLENHIVVKKMKELCEPEQTKQIVRTLLELAALDLITDVEDREVRLIAQGLGVSDPDYLRLRSEYREHLAVLQGLPKKD